MKRNIRCIIVDDEHGAIEILQHFISKVDWLELTASFSDPLQALNYLSQQQVELVSNWPTK